MPKNGLSGRRYGGLDAWWKGSRREWPERRGGEPRGRDFPKDGLNVAPLAGQTGLIQLDWLLLSVADRPVNSNWHLYAGTYASTTRVHAYCVRREFRSAQQEYSFTLSIRYSFVRKSRSTDYELHIDWMQSWPPWPLWNMLFLSVYDINSTAIFFRSRLARLARYQPREERSNEVSINRVIFMKFRLNFKFSKKFLTRISFSFFYRQSSRLTGWKLPSKLWNIWDIIEDTVFA